MSKKKQRAWSDIPPDSIKRAINMIKNSPYEGTHIKVELEANLNRNDDDDDYYNPEYQNCHNCDGSGYLTCDCEESDTPTDDCEECDGSGEVACAYCGGEGSIEIERESHAIYDTEYCEDYILENVSPEAREATTFHKFYYDGSVDSEFTFTVPIDNPEYVIEYINAFNALADVIGNGMDTGGAGMHIAILRDVDGGLRSGKSLNKTYSNNFKQTVLKLMPALLLLSSASHRSRGLGYRKPNISGDKYSAIHIYQNNFFEFRIFETCYDRPYMFYDYLCTIAECIKYYNRYSSSRKINLFSKPKTFRARNYNDGRLSDYFLVKENLQILGKGISYIKPSYRTIQECLQIRNFKIDNKTLDKYKFRTINKLDNQYASFVKRHQENMSSRIYNNFLDMTNSYMLTRDFHTSGIVEYVLKNITREDNIRISDLEPSSVVDVLNIAIDVLHDGIELEIPYSTAPIQIITLGSRTRAILYSKLDDIFNKENNPPNKKEYLDTEYKRITEVADYSLVIA